MTDSKRELTRLRQAAAIWLAARRPKPACLGYEVPTCNGWLKADVVACWLNKRKKRNQDQDNDEENVQSLAELHHVIMICGVSRESCWPECDSAEEIVAEVKRMRQEAEVMEEAIRRQEPELRADDVLFEEFAIWEYERSVNQQYQQLRRRVAELEQMLYQGTRMEKLAARPMAEKMYLVTPAGMLQEQELRRDWGLIWVNEKNEAELIREGKKQQCQLPERLKLFQNVLASNMNAIMTMPENKAQKARKTARAIASASKKKAAGHGATAVIREKAGTAGK